MTGAAFVTAPDADPDPRLSSRLQHPASSTTTSRYASSRTQQSTQSTNCIEEVLDERSQSPSRPRSTPPAPSVEPDDTHNTSSDGPPAKKRKVAGHEHKSSPRLVSPPWKRVAAEGPTSFVVDGRRKSGRTNIIPLDLQPQSNRRQTRAAFDKAKVEHQKHAKPLYNVSARVQKNFDPVIPPRSPPIVKRTPTVA